MLLKIHCKTNSDLTLKYFGRRRPTATIKSTVCVFDVETDVSGTSIDVRTSWFAQTRNINVDVNLLTKHNN